MPDEAHWTRLLRERDPRALEAIYAYFGGHVYRAVFRLVRDAAASEDIVQDSFTRLWNSAGALSEDATQLGPLVFTIARHRAFDYLRARGARARFQHSLEVESCGDAFPSPDADLISKQNQRLVGKALEHLNTNQKRVIEMAYYGGLSQSQIACRLNQPLGTVKSWSRSALATLRTRMEEVQSLAKTA